MILGAAARDVLARDPDRVYAAVMGHLFGPNEQRGVYRSTDGGENWQRILYANEQAGAVDLAMDPTNPRILYATTWRVIRTPYSLESGGEGSGIWKSVDGNTPVHIPIAAGDGRRLSEAARMCATCRRH